MNRSYIYMLIAAVCWAGGFISGKLGSAEVGGIEMSFYRFVIAALCLFLYIRAKGLTFRIGRRNIIIICVAGSFGMLGYHLLFFKSIALISVLESSSINAPYSCSVGSSGFCDF